MDYKIEDGTKKYLVKWVGIVELTWEEESNMSQCIGQIADFHYRRGRQEERASRTGSSSSELPHKDTDSTENKLDGYAAAAPSSEQDHVHVNRPCITCADERHMNGWLFRCFVESELMQDVLSLDDSDFKKVEHHVRQYDTSASLAEILENEKWPQMRQIAYYKLFKALYGYDKRDCPEDVKVLPFCCVATIRAKWPGGSYSGELSDIGFDEHALTDDEDDDGLD